MQIIREGEDVRAARRVLGGTVALVPTMGALHDGHLTLVREARKRADRVVATIFVNPLQFGEGEDLGRYPRQEERDLELLAAQGCDLVWLPGAAELYPPHFSTSITVAGVSERWEGAARPGHFAGVATVVAKLLIAVAPDVAVFGEKDWQQLGVVRRMVADLGLPVEVAGVPTVREADGLALSSRNAYLSAEERRAAAQLPEALKIAADALRAGRSVGEVLANAMASLNDAGFGPIDYVALVDETTLEPLDRLAPGARLIAAARLGATRLIDNLSVTPAPQPLR